MAPNTLRGRHPLPDRRPQITQKVTIGGQRRLYISLHDDPTPQELFLRIHGTGVTAEVTALYDTIARMSSLALQCGASLEEVGEMLYQSRCEPAGPVQGDRRIKACQSVVDYVGRYLLVYGVGREDVAHVRGEEKE